MYLLTLYTVFLLGMWSYVYNYCSVQFQIQVLIRSNCTCKLSHLSELTLKKCSNPHANKIGHLAISAESSKFRLGPKRRGYKICEDLIQMLPTHLYYYYYYYYYLLFTFLILLFFFFNIWIKILVGFLSYCMVGL